jgi:hypothetical protein
LSAQCLAADNAASAAPDAPLLDVKLGYNRDYVGSKDAFYYNFSLLGKPLASSGTTPTFADYASGGLADVSARQYTLAVQRGQTVFGGTQLQAYDLTKLNRFVPALEDFNLVLGVDAQQGGSTGATYTAGAEYRPLDPAGILFGGKLRATSFLVFGAAYQNMQPNGMPATESGSGTFRALISQTEYRSGRANKKSMQTDIQPYISDFDTVGKMASLLKKFDVAKSDPHDPNYSNPNAVVGPDAGEQGVFDKVRDKYVALLLANKAPTDAQWIQFLNTDFYTGPGTPDAVLWADGNGRYAFNAVPGGRYRAIYSLNVRYYLHPEKDSSAYLQVQYLNGFSEAAPTARTNALVALLGFKL